MPQRSASIIGKVNSYNSSFKWKFWIDRGGTFTDIVAQRDDGTIVIRKFLSENPNLYEDPIIYGIHSILGKSEDLNGENSEGLFSRP